MSSSSTDLDAALMVRFRNGDELAFAELVERYKRPVFNFVCRQIGMYGDAEDIAQNVFVQIFRSADRYEPSAKFTTWMFTIARNLCLNEFRRRQRHPLQSMNDTSLRKDPNDSSPQFADPSAHSPAIQSADNEIQDRIMSAIQKLPENQRAAVLLCRYEGLSYEDIAKILQISIGATKSLLHRARETLKEELQGILRET